MTQYSTATRPRRSFFGLAIVATIIAIAGTLITYLDSNLRQFFIFEQPKLHAIVKDAISNHGDNAEMIFDEIVTQLRKDPKIGPTLNPNSFRDPNEWVFNNAGGAMGSMYIIHASITEADDYFHILTGEQRAYSAGALVEEVSDRHIHVQRYPAGSMHYLKRGQVKQYMMPESGCWALELAQGWIPPMLPFGLADTLFSTLDLPTFWRTAVITAREMIANLLRGM